MEKKKMNLIIAVLIIAMAVCILGMARTADYTHFMDMMGALMGK